jgi:hypothetical protein
LLDADCGAGACSNIFHHDMGLYIAIRSEGCRLSIDNSDSMHRVTNCIDQSVPVSLYFLHDEESQDLARVQDTCLTAKPAQEIQIYLLYLDDILLSPAIGIYCIGATIQQE